MIVERQRQAAGRQDLRPGDGADQGSGGLEREARAATTASSCSSSARKVDIPIVQSQTERSGGKKIAWVRLAGFTSGSGEDVKTAVHKELKKGAQGVVLDLRHNGGGLLNEAVRSRRSSSQTAAWSRQGPRAPEHVYNAEGGAISPKIPVVVLVDEASASASEIVTGALQDRKRAKVVGTRTYGKGVFQEVEQIPTAARWTSPSASTSLPQRAQPGRRRRAQGGRRHAGHQGRPTTRRPSRGRGTSDRALKTVAEQL